MRVGFAGGLTVIFLAGSFAFAQQPAPTAAANPDVWQRKVLRGWMCHCRLPQLEHRHRLQRRNPLRLPLPNTSLDPLRFRLIGGPAPKAGSGSRAPPGTASIPFSIRCYAWESARLANTLTGSLKESSPPFWACPTTPWKSRLRRDSLAWAELTTRPIHNHTNVANGFGEAGVYKSEARRSGGTESRAL